MKKRVVVLAVLVACFTMVGIAFAAQAAAQPAPVATDGIPKLPFKLGGGILAGIVTGIWGGTLTVGAGILKSKDPVTGAQETLDISKAFETLLIGALVGGVGGAFKLAPSDTATFLTSSPIGAGIVAYAEMAWNAVFRQTAGLVRKTLVLFQTKPPTT